MRHFLFVLISVLLCACGDGARGLVFDDQGGGDNTAERARERTQRRLIGVIREEVPIQAIRVVIRELPEWREMGRSNEAGWYFAFATVDVSLPTLDIANSSELDDEVRDVVRSYLRPAVMGGAANIAITVAHESVQSEAPMPPTPAVPAAVAPNAPSGIAASTYIIQAGDTLAQISAVFYGSTQHWRRILDANPSLDPAHLVAGSTITIPPAP